jgi:dipeptidyl-peptidase-4
LKESSVLLKRTLTVERVFSDPNLSGPTPLRQKFSPDGRRVTYLRPKDENDELLDLWAYELATGTHGPLVRAEELVSPDELQVSEQEQARRERMRIRQSGIVDYDWSEKGNRLLFPLGGALYVYLLEAAPGQRVRRLIGPEQGVFDPQFSPDGERVAFVRDGNLYLVDVDSGDTRRLTTDGCGVVQNGVAEFVAQEEMDRHTGFWWSPDGKHIAYTQIDESLVPLVQRPAYYADRVEVVEQRYPAAGEANATVRVGVVSVDGCDTVWMDTGEETDVYVARVDWLPDGQSLAIQVQSRDQKTLELMRCDIATGQVTLLLRETDRQWVELHDDLRFLESGEFVWASERSGFKHLYLYDLDGHLIRALTAGNWPVDRVSGVDAEHRVAFFEGWTESPLERHLYRVSLQGGEIEQVTTEEGWHEAVLSSDCAHYLDTHSTVLQPSRVALRAVTGEPRAVLEPNVLPERNEYDWVAPEFVVLEAEDGTPLYGRLTRPPTLDPRRSYPAVVMVYGGPHAQKVRNAWEASIQVQLLAHTGFVVFELDNRGMGNRGKAFAAALYHRMGGVEVRDQLVGVAYLKSLPYVDGDRLGLFGWSYGGYMTLMCMLQAPDVFRAGVAVAPVTDWALYDTHYTERYMGYPEENSEGYERSKVVTYAEQLQGKLLLMHGMADDNVLFQHSVLLMDALQQASIPFEMMAYPGKKHGINGKPARIHLFNMIVAHLRRHLMS